MPTYNRERETEAAHALTHNQEVWSGQGWAVVTAGGLTAGSNALQLDVGSYEVLTGGTSTVSVGPTTIDAQLPDSDPYWLVVYVDGSGALQTAAGPEGAVAPGLGVDVREISSPPPPTLAAVGPVTVLGRVLVTDDGIADPRIDDRVFGGDRVFDAIDARTVEADKSTIEGTGNRDLQWEHLDSVNGGTSISLNVSDYSVYLVDYILQFDNVSGDNIIRFNGDSGTNYQYYDETGSKTTGVDGIPFLTVNSNGNWRGGGAIKVFGGDFDESGINHEMGGGRIDRLAGYATVGGWLNNDNISSIDFDLLANGGVQIDVWGLLTQS